MDWLTLKYVVSALAALFAAVLCYRDKDGWGWFLFLAFVVGAQ